MKLLHTADWHIGRTLNGYSLLDEQIHAFRQILQIAKAKKVDGIVIAGDLYDRAVPNTDAVTTLDDMLATLNIENHFPIYAISGNHDGAKRLNYGREWMAFNQFHLNTLLEEAFTPIETPDTQIFMLPFFDPMDARVYYAKQGMPEEQVKGIRTINDAMTLVVNDLYQLFDPAKKHLLITHFAITPTKDKEIELTSETTSKVGGLASLTADQFSKFDYVLLGHIHTRFASPRENMRYSGSPVKFNVKEANPHFHGKGVEIIDTATDPISRQFFEIKPHTDLVVLKEAWETLMDPDFYQTQPLQKAWFAVTVKDFDRSKQLNVRAQLQKIYGTIVELDYQDRHQDQTELTVQQSLTDLSPDAIVDQFFHAVTGKDLSKTQTKIVDDLFVDLRKER